MSETLAPSGLFDRAIRRITNVWRDMAASVSGEEGESIADQMRACLTARGGEVSARNRAAKLARTYLALDGVGRIEFLRTLAAFDSDPDTVAEAYARVQGAADAAERAHAKSALRAVLEPPRVRLLTQFTTIPDGMRFLVDLRATMLEAMRSEPSLAPLEADLRRLLASWFDVGFLELARIDWNSPAALLERLVGYEAVHHIRSWRDLKNRLDSDRRCYAFFHPRMAGEPLIFVEVALVQGLSASVQALLDEKAPLQDPRTADTAIFYSISNCQPGLARISFGNFLIKQVVELLSAEFRNLVRFATLSPVPGFRRWLDAALADPPPHLLSEEESAALRTAAPPEGPAPETGAAALAAILARRGWFRDAAMVRAAEPVLTRLCARYLLLESRDGRARDPVAHFHLSNGARLERITLLADTSEKGAKEGATIMVNYLYDPARIEQNHEDYMGDGKRGAATAVRRLARGWA
jgi:malonyl-CoA decarboxylase